MTSRLIARTVAMLLIGTSALAQDLRDASPQGTASTEIRGQYVGGGDEPVYRNGKWIEILYGRPIRRGRDLWGSGTRYGQNLNSGAPVWRAGANVSTLLKNEVPLVINGKTLAPGEYTLFIDLKPNKWTLIVSSWAAQREFDPGNRQSLWGSFGYTPAKDMVRATMKLETLPHSVDQLTWMFLDMSDAGGTLAIEWDKTMASVSFTIGN